MGFDIKHLSLKLRLFNWSCRNLQFIYIIINKIRLDRWCLVERLWSLSETLYKDILSW